jgi:hypothetical protein
VKEEKSWRRHLALISDGVLSVEVTTWENADGVGKHILSQLAALGLEAEPKKGDVRVKMMCAPEDPVGSAARGVGSLLKVLASVREKP